MEEQLPTIQHGIGMLARGRMCTLRMKTKCTHPCRLIRVGAGLLANVRLIGVVNSSAMMSKDAFGFYFLGRNWVAVCLFNF